MGQHLPKPRSFGCISHDLDGHKDGSGEFLNSKSHILKDYEGCFWPSHLMKCLSHVDFFRIFGTVNWNPHGTSWAGFSCKVAAVAVFLGKVQLRELCFGCTTCCYLNLSMGHSMRQFFAIHFFWGVAKWWSASVRFLLSGSKFYPAVPGAIQAAIFCHSHVDLGLSPLDLWPWMRRCPCLWNDKRLTQLAVGSGCSNVTCDHC